MNDSARTDNFPASPHVPDSGQHSGPPAGFKGESTPPVVLLGHGSRSPKANAALAGISAMVAELTGWNVSHACMELSPPTLDSVVGNLVEKGHRRIIVMPFFLFQGIHVQKDIPQMLSKLTGEHPDLRVIFTDNLGIDRRLAEIAVDRIKAALT